MRQRALAHEVEGQRLGRRHGALLHLVRVRARARPRPRARVRVGARVWVRVPCSTWMSSVPLKVCIALGVK